MTLYAFRIVHQDNITHHGMVSANSNHDLFQMIDQFVDPALVEVKKIKGLTGFCCRTQEQQHDDPLLKAEYSNHVPHETNPELEFTEELADTIDNREGWYRPNWKNY